MPVNPPHPKTPLPQRGWFFPALLALVLAVLFRESFRAGWVLFSNDNPYGIMNVAWWKLPDAIFGCWIDLNWLGISGGSLAPCSTVLAMGTLGALGFSKWFAAGSIFALGVSAWLLFRAWKFKPVACVFGGLAAALNSAFFSQACWGLGSQLLTFASAFLALALLVSRSPGVRWLRLPLAGLAVGVGVIEGGDIGALFSLFVAALAIYHALIGEGSPASRIVTGAKRVAVIAVFAAFIAAQTVLVLVGTQIKGVSGTDQNQQTKAEKWDWATQWSLPKKEILGVAVPGLFGYRMDTLEGGQYWGEIGQSPGWQEHHQGFPRFSGTGYYAGILVVALAAWALLQAAQRRKSIFSDNERKWVWLLAVIVAVCSLLAFGRYATLFSGVTFYHAIYALPFFSTIRNPNKYMFFVEWALVVLSAFGVEGLCRYYATRPAVATATKAAASQPGSPFDRQWLLLSVVLAGMAVIGWLIYSGSGTALGRYLQNNGFGAADAPAITRFSIGQAGRFVVLLLLALGAIWAVMRGRLAWAGRNWSGIILCGLLVADLGRANLPWIVHWNYEYKYATNPVIEFLRDKPYEQRVAGLPFRAPPQASLLEQVYRIEWAQHHFQYYNIQSLDIVQMPRQPVDMTAYEGALQFKGTEDSLPLMTRRWELSNTRYLLGPAGFLDVLNGQVDPVQRRFRYAMRFELAPKPGVINPTQLQDINAVASTNGTYALFEFTGALPRVKLYSNWQVSTNDQATLDTLVRPSFNPQETVLVSAALPAPTGTNDAGTVSFTSYSPAHIKLKADARTNAVLLLNDHYDPNWVVTVDGQPQPLLRCNYIMRGVQLAPGSHTVEFEFRQPTKALYVTFTAMGIGVVLLIAMIVSVRRKSDVRREA